MARRPEPPAAASGTAGPLAAIRRRLLFRGDDVQFAALGFRTDRPRAREHLEDACAAFVAGYNAVLRDDVADPAAALAAVPPAVRGSGYEGAGAACAMLDVLTRSRGRRVARLLAGSGGPYLYPIHAGVGFGLAQLRLPGWGGLAGALDPLLRWLALDGRGFRQGFLAHRRHLRPARSARPRPRTGGRVHDQGLGRGLWFVESCDTAAAADRVEGFHPGRRADLWSGVGFAAAYLGGADAAGLHVLVERCGRYRAHLAQGAVFAAVSRTRSGVVPPHTEHAVAALTSVDVATAAAWGRYAVATLEAVFEQGRPAPVTAYDQVRALIRQAWHERTRRTP